MHLSLILLMVGLAFGLRFSYQWMRRYAVGEGNNWTTCWQLGLSIFLIPPLLLASTAIAVLGMGHHGMMLGLPVGRVGCLLGISFLTVAGILLLLQGMQTWKSLRQILSYPVWKGHKHQAYLLATPTLFAAELGWWQSRLVISQGLLDMLSAEQVDAVLMHEQAHRYYRDSFWFFWLGWIRRLTCWLPHTQALWQELLLLRELRADRWATRSVDPLILAETLLLFAQSPTRSSTSIVPVGGVAFHSFSLIDRLEARIDSLLSDSNSPEPITGYAAVAACLCAISLPLFTLLLHRSIAC